MVEDLTDGVFEPPLGQRIVLRGRGEEKAGVIERWSAGPHGVVAKFSGLGSREDAEAHRRWEVAVAREDLPPRAEGAFYDFELVGLPVETADHKAAGTVEGLYRAGAVDILTVREGDRTFDVPFVRSHVVEVKPGEKVVIVPYHEE